MEHLLKVRSAMPMDLGTHPLSSKNKRKSRTERLPKVQSINFANHVSPSTNNKTVYVEPSPGAKNESFESVRSRLRESLAAALAFVSAEERKMQETSSIEEKSSQGQLVTGNQALSATNNYPPCTMSGMTSKADEHNVIQKYDGSCGLRDHTFNNEYAGDSTTMMNCWTKEFETKHFSLKENTSFNDDFVLKDELLQENRICWASVISTESSELNDGVGPKGPKWSKFSQHEITGHVNITQILASNIEVELFRLFGGVNKKYKEKGRSLLFNLKDRNNPELRERVFSGEITPEHLCLMTTEELASKQLSEWRIAKAEELAQMVVLPDSDVDLRRMVKKTHKGEFRVEVEQDDSISVEVALGANSPILVLARTSERKDSPKSANNEVQNLSKPSETGEALSEKVDPEVHLLSNLDTEDMLEPMVDGQEAKYIPPIVSFDEFMESFDSELPSEKSSMDAEQHTLTDDRKLDRSDSKVESTLKNLDQEWNASRLDYSSEGFVVGNVDAGSAGPLDMFVYQPIEIDSKHENKNPDHSLGHGAVFTELDKTSIKITSSGEHIWEGLVQLNISSLVTFLAFFKSGKKAPTEEWPRFLEVKGRVRVDAFEKFLQELPLSRSRAVMVVHFVRKDGSPLTEAVDSFVDSDRLGYAEPAPGVELYLCPPHAKTIRMLGRFDQEEHAQSLASTGDGLIGVVVWRRTARVASAGYPGPPSSHQKHSSTSRTRHSTSKKQQPTNAMLSSQPPMPAQVDDDVDDVPPGFGPAAGRKEDDLPEFYFQGGSLNVPEAVGLSMAPSRGGTGTPPVEHMRELIHRLGHDGEARISPRGHEQLPIQPWEDDDDDIPEWQPHQGNRPSQTITRPLPLQGCQRLQLADGRLVPAPPQHPTTTSRITISRQQLRPLATPPPTSVVVLGSHSVQHPGARWPGASAEVGFSTNGSQGLRPCHYGGGRPVKGPCYGREGFGDPQVAMDWRYLARSRGV